MQQNHNQSIMSRRSKNNQGRNAYEKTHGYCSARRHWGYDGSYGNRKIRFTPILPMMMDNHLFSPAGAGYLASSNYLGYLIGAFILTLVQVNSRSRLLLVGLIGSIVTTWGMGNSTVLRYGFTTVLSGLASAVVFVLASSMVMDRLSTLQAGLFYGGVGAGIL